MFDESRSTILNLSGATFHSSKCSWFYAAYEHFCIVRMVLSDRYIYHLDNPPNTIDD